MCTRAMIHMEHPPARSGAEIEPAKQKCVSDSTPPPRAPWVVSPCMRLAFLYMQTRKAPKLRSHGLQIPKVERSSCTAAPTGYPCPRSPHTKPLISAVTACAHTRAQHSRNNCPKKKHYKIKRIDKNRGTT